MIDAGIAISLQQGALQNLIELYVEDSITLDKALLKADISKEEFLEKCKMYKESKALNDK